MFPLGKNDDVAMAYRQGLIIFANIIDRAEESGKLNDGDWFASTLKHGIRHYGLDAQELSVEEHIARGTISKWVNNKASPPIPTRKTVINWAKKKLHQQIQDLNSN